MRKNTDLSTSVTAVLLCFMIFFNIYELKHLKQLLNITAVLIDQW